MSFTRARWATDLLKAIGNFQPTLNTRDFVVGWTWAETGGSGDVGARFNLLNTTQPWPGSSLFTQLGPSGDFGVRNYASYQDGIDANAKVLNNGLYTGLLQALINNDENALGFPGSNPSAGVQQGLQTWSGSSNINGYIRNIFDNTTNFGQPFTYGSAGSNNVINQIGSGTAPDSAANELAALLGEIDVASEITNPFQGVNNLLTDWGTLGNNLVGDTRGLVFRLLIIIIGFMLVAKVVLSFVPEGQISENFQKAAEIGISAAAA